MQFTVTDASRRKGGEARVLLLWGRRNSLASRVCRQTGGQGLGIRGAVCRLSTYASGRTARVKYQEQLQQIEGLAVMGARPGKCTL